MELRASYLNLMSLSIKETFIKVMGKNKTSFIRVISLT